MAKKSINNKAQKTPPQAKLADVIKVPQEVFRVTTDFNKYRQAVQSAENLRTPQRYPLLQLYNQTVLDPHVSACMTQRNNAITGAEFCVFDKAGKENEEKTKLVRVKWFREFVEYALDSIYWGHSLIQFEDVIIKDGIDQFKAVELVPRQYVKPEFHFVGNSIAAMPPDGKDYLEQPQCDWCISVGKPRDLGLLLKITPLYIWKKNAFGAWAEFAEKFGTPMRIGKTDSTDRDSVEKMEGMLRNMGVAAWGLFKTDDHIELLETRNQDAFEVFDKMIDRCNKEISKIILGQTMTTEDGSSRSQAEVHERVLESVAFSDRIFIESVINDQLVPLMNNLGFGLDGFRIGLQQDDEWNLEQKGKFDIELIKTGKFTMTPEYIKEKYGTEVTEVKEEKDDKMDDYKDALLNLYK